MCAQAQALEEVGPEVDTLALPYDTLAAPALVAPPVQVEQELPGNLYFELLTCSPGQEVYELYGHTALRAVDGQGMDVVFNYGVFEFSKPHFVWNFVLGRTDYTVQPIPFDIFLAEYEHRGSSVVSQRLNLTQAEARRLMASLVDNTRPEHREYRYNYLTNNCTTKVRDIIERHIDGEVMYHDAEKKTYRECLHYYTAGHPWAELGDDLLLGAGVDTILTDRNSAFLPERLMDYYAQAKIYDMEGNSRPLLTGPAEVLLQKRDVVPAEPGFPLSPLTTMLCFAGLCLLVMACEVGFKRMIWGYDILVMLAQGLCGLLLTFMLFFSEHPSVDSNWQVWLFNPLPLFCMPWVVWRAIKRQYCLYHLFNFSILLLFLVFSPWIPQNFASVTLPLACVLLTRPLSYYIFYRRVEAARPAVDPAEDSQAPDTLAKKSGKKKNTK